MDRSDRDKPARQPMMFTNQEPLLEVPLQQTGILNLRQAWRLFKFNHFFIISLVMITASVTMLHSFFSVPEYKSAVTVSISPVAMRQTSDTLGVFSAQENVANKIALLSDLFDSPDVAFEVTDQVINNHFGPLFLISRTGMKRLMTSFGLVKPQSVEEALKSSARLDVAQEVMKHLKMRYENSSSAVLIEATTANPELSAFLANKGAEALLHINQKVGMKRTLEMKEFLTKQSAELGVKLKGLEERLAAFQSSNYVISIDEAERTVYHVLYENGQASLNTEMLLKSNENLIAQIKEEMKRLKDNIADPTLGNTNLYLSSLQHKLSMLQYYEQAQTSHVGAEDRNIKSEISSVAAQYQKALEARTNLQDAGFMSAFDYYQSLEFSLSALKKEGAKMKSDLGALEKAVDKEKMEFPKLALKLQRLTALKRNIIVTTDLYMAVKKKLQETAIQEAGTANDISVVSPATVPTQSHSLPVGVKMVFALTLALFGGFVIILSKEALLPIIHDRYDLEREGLVVMGELPFSDKASRKPMIIVDQLPNSFEKEALRSMRIRLSSYVESYMGRDGATTILITSPKHGNGKTFTASNLAAVLAKAHNKVLLLDLDLINPSVDKYFEGVNAAPGVQALASESEDGGASVITAVSDYLHVAFGTNALENPADFLDSDTIPQFIKNVKNLYDYIIIDSPPVLGMSEPVMIAEVADMIMLVVEHRATYREDVVLTSEALNDVYSKPLVAVINGVHKEFTHQPYLKKYRPAVSAS